MDHSREHYAQQAAALERQWEQESLDAEAARRARFGAAKRQLAIAGISAALAVASFAALPLFHVRLPMTWWLLLIAVAFGFSGLKKLLRAL